jgi:hypothetical protein
VRRCIVVTATTSSVGAESAHIFTQLPHNVTAACGIHCLACQDEFLMDNPLNVKENDEHALDFALRRSWLFFFSP